MNLYALIIGINDYHRFPLSQCVNDAAKIAAYLDSLQSSTLTVHKHILTNGAATKQDVQAGISDFLGQATDDDIAFFYFSGHGAQEKAAGRFHDEHDGMLETLVCYFDKEATSGFLLANKEIRYLFSQFEHNPHLVSVFDCCHAGDMVRSGAALLDPTAGQVKRLAGSFPARAYEEFIFSEKISEVDLQHKLLAKLIPIKNSIHIGACNAGELSWEDNQGAVFTRYLLQLLDATDGKISYGEIARWAKLGLKETTRKKQSPIINVQGTGKLSAYSPWLMLHEGQQGRASAHIVYNPINGWMLSQGSVMGIKLEEKVYLEEAGKTHELIVLEVGLDHAYVQDPQEIGLTLDQQQTYPVSLRTTYTPLTLFVNNVDAHKAEHKQVEQIISEQEGIELGDAQSSDFFINLFNGLVYISLPHQPFRPLAKQIDIFGKDDTGRMTLKPASKLREELQFQLTYLLKWHHFFTLENGDNQFDSSPIKVEIQVMNERGQWPDSWMDVTGQEHLLHPRKQRVAKPELGNPWAQVYQIRVSNISTETLHVGVLALGSDLSINASPWDNRVIKLQPNESKLFFDHANNTGSLVMDAYKETYNWPHDWVHFKFIVNNYDDFTNALPDYVQPALPAPMTLSRIKPDQLAQDKTLIVGNVFDMFVEKWGTVTTTLKLENPEFNIVSADSDLGKLWDYYINKEELAPFIGMLYLAHELDGLVYKSETLPTRRGEADAPKGIASNLIIGLANRWSHFWRKRNYKDALERFPNQPKIVAEGDSWFLFPIRVKDIIDYVMEQFPVYSIAAAGDELQNYINTGQLLKAVEAEQPKFVLISGGGNDIIGKEMKDLLRANVPAGSPAADYLNENFDKSIRQLREGYAYFISTLQKAPYTSVEQLIVHGYDYIRMDHAQMVINSGWVNRYMIDKGITQVADREKVIRYMIDTFNEMLIDLTKNDPFVTYLNLRNQVDAHQWYDEIHPNDEGNHTLGNIFIEEIRALDAKLP